jgi:outer membrane receptor protein involved in Fe transport
VDDVIETVRLSQSSDFIPGATILFPRQFQNVGEATIFGGDLRVDYQKSFRRMSLKAWLNYSWTDGEVETGGGTTEPLLQVARNKVKGGITARYAGKYFITPRFIWIDKTPIFPSADLQKTSSYAVVHLHAGADNIYKGLSGFIDVRNLLDVKFFASGNLGTGDFDGAPQDPRTIVVGLKYKF